MYLLGVQDSYNERRAVAFALSSRWRFVECLHDEHLKCGDLLGLSKAVKKTSRASLCGCWKEGG